MLICFEWRSIRLIVKCLSFLRMEWYQPLLLNEKPNLSFDFTYLWGSHKHDSRSILLAKKWIQMTKASQFLFSKIHKQNQRCPSAQHQNSQIETKPKTNHRKCEVNDTSFSKLWQPRPLEEASSRMLFSTTKYTQILNLHCTMCNHRIWVECNLHFVFVFCALNFSFGNTYFPVG